MPVLRLTQDILGKKKNPTIRKLAEFLLKGSFNILNLLIFIIQVKF